MNAPDCICSPGRLPLGAFCAGRDDLEREALHDDRISIRAPRAGRDCCARMVAAAHSDFNPRAPCGVRHKNDGNWRGEQRFQSTHPVRGATWQERARSTSRHNFNPRTPCGVRRWIRLLLPGTTNFNPRAPCGARLDRPVIFGIRRPISIHAPRVGRDSLIQAPLCVVLRRFQSTHPVRGATMDKAAAAGNNEFQSTRPVWGATPAR